MKFSTHIKPISYLENHAAEIVKMLNKNRQPLLITQNGEAQLVVMDVKSYEAQKATLALLRILAIVKLSKVSFAILKIYFPSWIKLN